MKDCRKDMAWLCRSDSRHACLANSDTRSSQLLPEALIMFRQTTELELRHRLLVWSCGDHSEGLLEETGGVFGEGGVGVSSS